MEQANTANNSKEDSFEEYQKSKRRRLEVEADRSTNSVSLSLLLETYEQHSPSLHYKASIIKYWEGLQNDEPVLCQLAGIVNTAAPTEVSVERVFSILGVVYNNRRARLNPILLQHLMLINLNKEMVPEINKRALEEHEN